MSDLTFPGSIVADGQPKELERTLGEILATPGFDTFVATHSGVDNLEGRLTKSYVQTALDYIV